MTAIAPYSCDGKDSECPGDLFCYSGEIDWVRRDYAVAQTEYVCICDVFYGQSGENCSEFSWGNKFFVGFYATFGLICVVPAAVLAVALLRHVKGLKKNSKPTPLFYTALLVWLGLICMVLRNLTEIAAIRTPTNWTKTAFDSTIKLNKWRLVSQLFFSAALVLHLMAAVRIVVQWIDVVRKSKAMRTSSGEGFERIKKMARFAQYFLILVTVPLIVLQMYFFLGIFLFLCTVALASAYTFGAVQLTKLLSSMISAMSGRVATSEKALASQRRMIVSIRKTAIFVIAGLSLGIITGGVYSAITLSGSRNLVDPQKRFPSVLLLAKSPEFSLLIVLVAIEAFTLGPLKKTSSSESSGKRSGKIDNSTTGSGTPNAVTPHNGNTADSARDSARLASSAAGSSQA